MTNLFFATRIDESFPGNRDFDLTKAFESPIPAGRYARSSGSVAWARVDEEAFAPAEYVTRMVRAAKYGERGDQARCITIEYALDKKRFGRRVVVFVWIDEASLLNGLHPSGTVVVKDIEGDGRRVDGSFVTHREYVAETATVVTR